MSKITKIGISAIAAATVFAASASAAFAVEAVATGSVNVRTGPSTAYSRVDTLVRGENVDISECKSGWCYVTHNGPDGWVSANYLARPRVAEPRRTPRTTHRGTVTNQPPSINFHFGVGTNGSGFGLSFGNTPPRNAPHRRAPQVCFYDGANFTGASICPDIGTSRARLNGFWNNRVSSIAIEGGAAVTVCRKPGFSGFCRTYTSSRSTLPRRLDNRISSVDIR